MTSRATMVRSLGLLAAAGAATVLVVACGGAGQASKAPPSTAKPAGMAHLVDNKGDTLYVFAADKGDKSNCTGSCASFWPPVKAGTQVQVSGGGKASGKVGTTTRSDGSKQLTYDGHPLYRYAGDSTAGQDKGQGKNINGGLWWIVSPSGTAITTSTSTSKPSTSKSKSSGGGGGWA